MDRLPCCQGNRVNTAFCGPARDTLLSNRNTEKLNYDTNYTGCIKKVDNFETALNLTSQNDLKYEVFH